MLNQRKIRKIIVPEITSDGAGVILKRSIASKDLNYLDPFLLFDHFGSINPDDYIAGFPMHPHRGIETVTYMLEGVIKHRDSIGNEGILKKGDIQWMTAGSGIMHEEMPQIKEGKMEGFQLWVNLPAKNKMINPRYQEYKNEEIPVVNINDDVKIKIIAGEYGGKKGIIKDIDVKPTYLDITLSAKTVFEHKLSKKHSAFAYVFEGSGQFDYSSESIDRKMIRSPMLVVYEEGDYIKVKTSDEGVRFLLISGKPLNEPIARYGPFVMNSKQEIREAIEDLKSGNFVKSLKK